MVKWTNRKRIAIAILFVYVIVVTYFVPSIFSISTDVINSGQPRTFQIPIYLTFNSTSHIGLTNESDAVILMNFTYPHGTLVVNEPVTINATATIKGNQILHVGQILIIFPNCLASPISYDENNMPIPGELFFDNIIYEDHLKYPNVTVEVQPETVFELIDNTKVAWAIDGDYVPTIEITFFDGTNQTIVANDISIHVYPQEELTQIETNKVSVIITLALFIFSAVGVVTLFFDLWDSEEKVCKYEKESKSETAKSNGTHNYSNKFKTKSGGKKT